MRIIVLQVFQQAAMLFFMTVVFFPLWSGFTAVCLAQLKGRPWTFGDFFSGFQHFGALAGVGLASQLLSMVFISLPTMVLTIAAIQGRNFQLLQAAPMITLAGMIPLLFFQIRLFVFAPAIIFDRNRGAMDAMKANWELTRGHFWGLLGVSFLLGLITLGGALACFIGLLFAVPYTVLILNAGYLLISDRRDPADYPPQYDA